MARLINEPNNRNAPSAVSSSTLEERLEALGRAGQTSMPADMESRIRRRLAVTLAVPREDARVAAVRRLMVLLVTAALLWTFYVSCQARRAQGQATAPRITHGIASQPAPTPGRAPMSAASPAPALCR